MIQTLYSLGIFENCIHVYTFGWELYWAAAEAAGISSTGSRRKKLAIEFIAQGGIEVSNRQVTDICHNE